MPADSRHGRGVRVPRALTGHPHMTGRPPARRVAGTACQPPADDLPIGCRSVPRCLGNTPYVCFVWRSGARDMKRCYRRAEAACTSRRQLACLAHGGRAPPKAQQQAQRPSKGPGHHAERSLKAQQSHWSHRDPIAARYGQIYWHGGIILHQLLCRMIPPSQTKCGSASANKPRL